MFLAPQAVSNLIHSKIEIKWIYDGKNDSWPQESWRARPLMCYKPGFVSKLKNLFSGRNMGRGCIQVNECLVWFLLAIKWFSMWSMESEKIKGGMCCVLMCICVYLLDIQYVKSVFWFLSDLHKKSACFFCFRSRHQVSLSVWLHTNTIEYNRNIDTIVVCWPNISWQFLGYYPSNVECVFISL